MAIMVAILLLVLLGFVGLALDSSHVMSAKQQLQAAADAAALAAASKVEHDPQAANPTTPYDVTRQAAVAIAVQNNAAKTAVQIGLNYPNAPTGDVVVGIWNEATKTFTPDTTTPNAVRVTARRSASAGGGALGMIFGRLFQKNTVDISRTAVATTGSVEEPVILILDPTGSQAMALKGTPHITVPGKVIHVNSSAADALYMNGAPNDPRIRAKVTRVFGNAQYPVGSISPLPIVNTWVEPDYLMYLPQHPDPLHTLPNYNRIVGAGTYNPGWYPNGVNFSGGVAQLNPGVYVIGPPGIDLTGDAQLVGDGVMLFLDLGGSLKIAGQGTAGLDISAPTSGTYQGICYYQHRQNSNLCNIQGGGLFDMQGTMYLKTAQLEMDGNVHREVGRIVVFRQLLRGNGSYLIPGYGPPNIHPKRVFLVE